MAARTKALTMRRSTRRWTAFLVLGLLWVIGADAHHQARPARIISLIPAVTEMLYAIGAGPQVVGVSSFDTYPPDVKKVERVGALLDPNLERILALRPDLVVVYASQTDLREQLARARIGTFVYAHAGLADVTATLRRLGTATGRSTEASALARQIDGRIDAIRKRVAGRARPRTVTVFGRETRALRGIYASGGRGFIHDMVDAAGGSNVFADVNREAVQATSELILARRPEVILELRASLKPEEAARERETWNALTALPAVKSGRVFVLIDPRTVVPGPRIAEGVELIARVLHPEVFQ